MAALNLNAKPGQRRRSADRANFDLPTITQGEGALSHECYTLGCGRKQD